MATQRKAISIPPDEVEILKALYLQFGYPSDQYRRRDLELVRFVAAWNGLTNRSDYAGELLHFIVTQRKLGRWVTFDGTHKRLSRLSEDFLSKQEWTVLRAIYQRLFVMQERGSDNLAFNENLAQQISREFFERTGRTVLGRLLYAAIMQKRKRREWPTIREMRDVRPDERRQRPFGDIDYIAM